MDLITHATTERLLAVALEMCTRAYSWTPQDEEEFLKIGAELSRRRERAGNNESARPQQ